MCLQEFKIIKLPWSRLNKLLPSNLKNEIFSNIISVVNKYEYEDFSVLNHSFENLLRRTRTLLENVCVNDNVVTVCSVNSLIITSTLVVWIYIYIYINLYIKFLIPGQPSMPGPSHYPGFPITFRHTTLSRTPPDEWTARPRDLYLTTQNTQNRQTSMPPDDFKSAIPASQLPQTHRRLADCDRLNILLDNQNSSFKIQNLTWKLNIFGFCH